MRGRLVFEDLIDSQDLFFFKSLCAHLCARVQAHAHHSACGEQSQVALSFHFETGSLVCYGMHQASCPRACGILLSCQSAGIAGTCYRVQVYMGTSTPSPHICAASTFLPSHLPVVFSHRYLMSWRGIEF